MARTLELSDHFYAGVGRIFLWSFLVVGGLNLGMAALNRWLPDDAPAPNDQALVVYSMGMVEYPDQALLRQIYADLDYPQMTRLLLESANLLKDCDSQLGVFREQPVDWRYFQVADAGFREVENQALFPPPEDVYSIFVFGGSTVFGYGVAHDDTLPSNLQYWLNLNATEAVAVYNFGVGGVTSTQEYLLLEELLAAGHIPDALIFIHGMNDFNYVLTQRGELGCDTENQAREKWRNTLRCHADEYCLPFQMLFGGVDEKKVNLVAGSITVPEANDDGATNQAVVALWLQNKRAVEKLAAQHGIEVLFVMQPVPTYAFDLATHPFMDEPANPTEATYFRPRWGYGLWNEWYAAGVGTGNTLNLSHFMADEDELILWVDPLHYSPQFNGLLALEISQAILAGNLFDLHTSQPD